MKNIYAALAGALLLFFGFSIATAQIINREEARQIAVVSAERYCPSSKPDTAAFALTEGNRTLAWIFPLFPEGFIVISADHKATPVYAYAQENHFNPELQPWPALLNMIRRDLGARFDYYPALPEKEKLEISSAWEHIQQSAAKDSTFEVWPPAGSTTTGGWLETNWTQSSPYNNMCPMDLNAGARSIAGCPAVAMAQILNFLQNIKATRFGDADDYYHNYGTGNQFMIDDDYATWGFPSFDTLNKYLDTLENYFQNKSPMTDNMKAALTFACGTACTQVYTASGSGTFGVGQAAAAYQRFDYTNSRLVFSTDTSLSADLAWNMKNAYPAHLALVDPGETVGHNVVVDGYNTDDFFHFNFGWGGSSNGWYTMPPASMPYNLTVIEGVIMDIIPDSVQSSVTGESSQPHAVLYPNPANDYCVLQLNETVTHLMIVLRDLSGRIVFVRQYSQASQATIPTEKLTHGMYFLTVKQDTAPAYSLKLIKE